MPAIAATEDAGIADVEIKLQGFRGFSRGIHRLSWRTADWLHNSETFDNRSFYRLCLLHGWKLCIAVIDKFVRKNAILYQYVIVSTIRERHSLYTASSLLLVHIRRAIAPLYRNYADNGKCDDQRCATSCEISVNRFVNVVS